MVDVDGAQKAAQIRIWAQRVLIFHPAQRPPPKSMYMYVRG